MCESWLFHRHDYTHVYARNDSFVIETWLILYATCVYGSCHAHMHEPRYFIPHIYRSRHIFSLYVKETRLTHGHDSFTYFTRAMTYSQLRFILYATHMYVSYHLHMHGSRHWILLIYGSRHVFFLCMKHDPFTDIPYSHLYTRRDVFTCATWLIRMCDTYVWSRHLHSKSRDKYIYLGLSNVDSHVISIVTSATWLIRMCDTYVWSRHLHSKSRDKYICGIV